MADPIVNFFKSTLVGTYSDTDTSITIATGDGALLPDPSVDGAFNLTIFEGLQVTGSTEFEIVRVTARSGDVLTVTRGAESTTPLTIGSATHSILMSATKKTFDDINNSIENINLTTLSGVESITYDNTGDEVLQFPVGTTAQRPLSPATGYIRYNSDRESIEFYNGTNWLRLQSVEFNSLSLGVATATVTGNDATIISNVIANAERLTFNSSGDESFSLPAGTEAQRPSASAGYMRYNTDEDVIEAHIDGEWVQMDTSEYYSFQGSSFGYTSVLYKGGVTADIDRISLTSDGNGTDILDLTVSRRESTGSSSNTHGYNAGGRNNDTNVIDKFSFSTEANATDVGDAISSNALYVGHSSSSNGYISGNAGPATDIQKYSFGSDGNASKTADLTVARHGGAGASSSTHGYHSGDDNTIDKFSFATDSNATDVGDLIFSRSGTGTSSTTHGYHSGGYDGSSNRNEIEKYSFSSDGNSTDVGDLTASRRSVSGISSVDSGYNAGGFTSNETNIIDKFSFSSDANATDVGDLSANVQAVGTGTQV